MLSSRCVSKTQIRRRHIGIVRRNDAGEPSPALADFLFLAAHVPEIVPGAAMPGTMDASTTRGGSIEMGDKGPGSKGGGKKPKTSTKKKGGVAKPA